MALRRDGVILEARRKREVTSKMTATKALSQIQTSKEKLWDGSELLRPEITYSAKPVATYRDYTIDESDPIKERVRKLYLDMHTNMTYDFVMSQRKKWLKFNTFKASIMDALVEMNKFIDQSDPDVDVPNIMHAFQTAEGIRREHPDKPWFQLTGLVHDIGKIMHFYDEPQWAVSGDTFVMGCEWGPSIVYRDTSFKDNPDDKHPVYSTKYGIYKPHCGLDNVTMCWGHDEYLYQVLKHNKTTLPEEALYCIRYHSFYPWHAGGDYQHLCSKKDNEMLKWVLEFNKFDLYTKTDDELPDIEGLTPYYQKLIDQYIPGVLEW